MPSALFGFIHFRTHFRWKSDVKKVPRKTRTWMSIFGGFGWVVGAMSGAKKPFKSCNNDVKRWTKIWRFLDALQDAPGGRFGHPKPPCLISTRECVFELVSDTPSGGVQEASETGFWMVFGKSWHRFWKLVGVIFGSVWYHFQKLFERVRPCQNILKFNVLLDAEAIRATIKKSVGWLVGWLVS